ncbi:MAG: pitrilysin family protein [archaeon]
MSSPEFYKKKLKNGLTVLFESRKQPVVSVCSAVQYGSGHEPTLTKGAAHLIEHMTFKGTKTRTHDQIAREIEKKGGVINATTGEEVTFYWNKLPSKHLKAGIDISSDLILNPLLDAKEFEKEKKVVLEEIKMYRDNPRYHVMEKIKEMLYKEPFSIFGAGTPDTVSKLTREDIFKIYNTNYSTNNMILCVVGKADFEEICKLAEKNFPGRIGKTAPIKPVLTNKNEVEIRKGIDQANFMFGVHCPKRGPDSYAFRVLLMYLAGGMSSVLHEEIREKRGLVYTIRGDLDIGASYGYATIYAGTMKKNISKIKGLILEELKKIKNLNRKELEETKEQLIGLSGIASEDSTNVMEMLIQEEIAGGAERYYDYEKLISQVKLDDVRKAAKIKSYSTFALVPQ